MNVNVYVAELSSRIGRLRTDRAHTVCPDCIADLDRQIAEAQRELNGFIEFGNGIYWPSSERNHGG